MTSGIMAWLLVTFYVIKQATLKRGRGILVTRTHVRHYVARDEGTLRLQHGQSVRPIADSSKQVDRLYRSQTCFDRMS